MPIDLTKPPARPPTPETAETLNELPDLALFRAVARAEGAFRPWLDLGAALLDARELSPRTRELAILAVADEERCEYEWIQHASIALTCGVDQAEVQAVAARREADLLGEPDALVTAAARQFARATVEPGTMAKLGDELGEAASVELVLVLGHYLSIARFVRSFDLPTDDAGHVEIAGRHGE